MTNFNNNNNNNGGSSFDSFAQITVIGRMARDPESKQLPSGATVANGAIAVNHGRDDADFWNFEAWVNGNNSTSHDYIMQYTKRGQKVFVTGIPYLKQSKGSDGSYNYYPTIKILQIRGLEQRGDSNDQQGGFQQPQGGAQTPPQGGFQPPQGGFQQPQGGFQPPQGGFQPPQGGFQPPQGGFQQSQGGNSNFGQQPTPPAPPVPQAASGAPMGAPGGGAPGAPQVGGHFSGPPMGAPRQ